MVPNPNPQVSDSPQTLAETKGKLLSVDIAAQKAVAAARTVSDVETVGLADALGRICAGPVLSTINLPSFANSAMDGYAINRQCLTGSGPWTLEVCGRVVAGAADVPRLPAGSAMRIMTGAPIPEGADSVVMQEYCERQGDAIIIRERPAIGRHIRLPGEDVKTGTTLLKREELITARHLALLAACGCASVEVFTKVRIGLISTGNELVEPGARLGSGQIYNSNRTYLKARLDRPWTEVVDFGIQSDDPRKIQSAVRRAASRCDIVITTGGVSVGEEDHMLDVLQREAADLDVLKVAMRPGKPVTVGRVGSAQYFGLPGNPYACAITFMQIAWPAIRKTGGLEPRVEGGLKGIADFHYTCRPGRTEFLPVSWSRTDEYGRPVIERLGRGASAGLLPFAMARAIATVPADVDEVRPGDILALEPVDF